MSLTITNVAGSLGDWLSLTPLLDARPNSTVIAKDSPHTRRFAAVYQGLANVEFTDYDIPGTLETDEPLCFSQRILNRYGITEVNAIPVVRLTEEEIEWARSFLKNYHNPIAFNNTVGGARADKPDNDLCNYRRLPVDLANDIVQHLKVQDYTVLRFGVKTIQNNIYNNYDELDGTINIPDLNLRQLAACYHVIGKYVGTDSGDMHLMLAAGGFCEILTPPSIWHYRHDLHHYKPENFGSDPVRIVYHIFERKQS